MENDKTPSSIECKNQDLVVFCYALNYILPSGSQ